MKKVSSVKNIKIKKYSTIKKSGLVKPNIGKIYRVNNKMINSEAILGKTGGTSFENYNLDLMKLK